jgi:hypothetical protein
MYHDIYDIYIYSDLLCRKLTRLSMKQLGRGFNLKCHLFAFPMDPYALSYGVSGILLGWWATVPGRVEQAPCQCHCSCNLPETKASESGHWVNLGLLLSLSVLCNLICGVWFFLRKTDIHRTEFGLGFKGKSGKGQYGPLRGLEIVDQ